MEDTSLYLVCAGDDAEDLAWTKDLRDRLKAELDRRLASTQRLEVVVKNFTDFPAVADIAPLSLVGLVLPAPTRANGRGFEPAEAARIDNFRQACGKNDVRLLPLSRETARNGPPAPIAGTVSFKLPNVKDPAQFTALANRLLNLLCLRMAGNRRALFISYRLKDGLAWAERLAAKLKEREYRVWRDESRDRDDLPLIEPGSEAQETIQDAILDHGFVLVVDTVEAPDSPWVQEEVRIAYSHLLPMLPVVIEDGSERQRPAIGGRFDQLREAQQQVRITVEERDAALDAARRAGRLPSSPTDKEQATQVAEGAIDDAFMDKLEAKVTEVLLDNLKSRVGLSREAAKYFNEPRKYKWTRLSEPHQLYRAVLSRDAVAPALHLRFLVQCAPYNIILDETVANLRDHLQKQSEPYQFGILLHQTPLTRFQKQRLLRYAGGHILLLKPDELPSLPSVFALP